MPAFVLAIGVLSLFACGFIFYSRYLARKVYCLDANYVTPAHRFNDGMDYVPTNKHVLFGHHFISVAGAAPIVGPAIAVFWGWGPALAWIVLGTIFAAGTHDFGALVISVRHRARSIGVLAQDVISNRSRTLFLFIIFFLLTLVSAVFAVVIANLLIDYPGAVIPIFVEIPIAMAVGQYIYRTKSVALIPSIIGLIAMYLLIWVGHLYPIDITPLAEWMGFDNPRNLWVIILFIYCFIAARIPVWLLLQPRDYINSHQMVLALAVILSGALVGWNTIVAPMVNDVPDDSPNIFPFLFITIACGAISGFHALVCSGTTSKQIDKETDARHIGYSAALGEGTLALCSVLAVTAGVVATRADWSELYPDFATASGGAVGNFVEGVAVFASNVGVPLEIGVIFAAVVVISFAATSLDTAVRLQRYVIQEIAEIAGWKKMARNLTWPGIIAVLLGMGLALMPGGEDDAGYAFGVLWQLFGTTNQLMAALALAVIAVWLMRLGRNPIAVMIPMVFVTIMTVWALLLNLRNFIQQGEWVLAPLDAIILVLAMWVIVEALMSMKDIRSKRATGGTGKSVDAEASEETSSKE